MGNLERTDRQSVHCEFVIGVSHCSVSEFNYKLIFL